ncbi:hypothetical protein QCA50_011831 [Cerrena zonata]|uniref:FAD dependent oxidoreductase domain-containing protein n=1 Tax=Cerrena zonata TaxID=2478898 RepID=A0AAW0FVT4_9APHY
MTEENAKRVVVIGAGVAGLTTAIALQQKGYAVSIVAETIPTDPKSIRYTSIWAGAHHVSHADGEPKQEKFDKDTFDVMWELSAPGGEAEHCFLRLPQTDYYFDGRNTHLDWMPDWKPLPESSLIPNAQTGVSFTTLTIDTPAYLRYLWDRFTSGGGQFARGAVQHINQVIEGGPFIFSSPFRHQPVDALVLCPGLGARSLGGVEDKDVYPVRGQVVILKAPWIKFGRTASHLEQGLWTYIIPRRCGDVIVGGTKLDNDWYPIARPETTREIFERSLALCPELAPPEIRAQREPTVDDLYPIIVEEGCGFRPARKGGVRLDVEWVKGPKADIPVVSNYGHGGGGYQSSWGTASVVVELLEKASASKQV